MTAEETMSTEEKKSAEEKMSTEGDAWTITMFLNISRSRNWEIC